jgi:hypothetical protein
VTPGNRDQKDKQGQPVLKALKEYKVQLALLAQLVSTDLKDRKESRVHKDLPVQLDQPVQLDLLVQLDQQDLQDQPELLDLPDRVETSHSATR